MMIRCGSNNLEVDCTQSDLAVSVVSQVNPSCDGLGSITLGATGGDGDYSFSIDDFIFAGDITYSDLEPGSYSISVRDGNGCTASIPFQLDGVEPIQLAIESIGCEQGQGQITATATGGEGNYTFALNGATPGAMNSFSNLGFGIYDVTVNDTNGCSTTVSGIQIGVSLQSDILPIIAANCAIAGCHLDVRTPLFNTKANIIANAERIKIRTSEGTMPLDGPLPDSQVKLIADWVDCGAEDN